MGGEDMIKKGSIFRNKNFVLLWLGQLVSNVGSSMHTLAVMWYVLEVTGSTAKTGTSLVFTVLPFILLSPITGSLADRLDRKKIIVISDLTNGILVGIISLLLFTHNMELWMLYTLSALMSATNAFFSPAISAAIPSIIEKKDYVKANSLSQITRYGTSILGPALGGVLITIIGIPGLFLLNSISFLVSSFSESFIIIPKVKRDVTKKASIKEDFKEGLKYAVSNKKLLHVIIVGGVIINFFFAPISLFITVFSRDILRLGSAGAGTLLGAMSIGGLVMSFLVPLINKRFDHYTLMFIGLSLEGIFLSLFGFANNLYTSIGILVLLGGSFGIVNVSIGTVFQTIIPNNLMGRVSSIMGILCQVTIPLGYYLGGLILESYSVSTIVLISGVIVALAGLSTVTIAKELKLKKSATLDAIE